MKTKLELTPSDVEEAIRYWLGRRGYSVSKVGFDAGTRYGQFDQPSGVEFTGATAEVELAGKERKD